MTRPDAPPNTASCKGGATGSRRERRAGLGTTVLAALCGVVSGVIGVEISDRIERARDREIIRVVDGDTVRIASGENVRLAGFDAPESRRGDAKCEAERVAGLRATVRLQGLIGEGGVMLALLDGRDKYGRPLARLTLAGRDLIDIAVSEGWGQRWDGQTAKPDWCGEGRG